MSARLARRLSAAFWPNPGNESANRAAGNALIDRLRVEQVAALLDWYGGPEKGGRGPTFCLLQDRLARLGWRTP